MLRKRYLFPLTLSIIVLCAFWVLRGQCLNAELHDQECLAVVQEPLDALRSWTSLILRRLSVQSYITYAVSVALAGLVLVMLVSRLARVSALWSYLYAAAIALSLVGERAAFHRQPWNTLYFHVGALVLGCISLFLLWRRDRAALSRNWIAPGTYPERATVLEVGAVLIIFVMIIATRFYALNRLPGFWDAEGCPHRAIAASLDTIVEQELGAHVQQSSGMSWVLIHHLFNRVGDPLLFLLGERFIGVAISLINCLVVYRLLRYLRGGFAGVLGLIVYGFGPLDLEWSRLPTLHHLPVALGLFLTWATFSAFTARSWRAFLAVVILMVSTKYVYPSAKLLLAGPALGACGALVWEYRSWFGHKRKLLMIALGCVLFGMIRSILYSAWFQRLEIVTPVPMIQPSRATGSTWDSFVVLAKEGFGFLYEIFYGPYEPTHWTVQATIEPYRSLPSVCVVFATLALLRLVFLVRKPYALICIGLLIGGLIPGIVTGVAERRIAFSLVLLSLLAVVEVAWYLDTVLSGKLARFNAVAKTMMVVLVGGAMFTLQTQGYFSRVHAKTIQNMLAERVRPMVTPDTLVVYLAEERRCEFFYGIYDKLLQSGGRIAYANANDTPKGPQAMIQDPTPVLNSWYYSLTELKPQIPALKESGSWARVLYVFQETRERQEWQQELSARYPAGKGFSVEFPDLYKQKVFFFDTAPERLSQSELNR
jgi:hypothetical protein